MGLLAMSVFLQPWYQIGCCHPHFLFHVGFPWHLLFITITAEIPVLQNCNFIKRKVAQSNAETMNYLQLVIWKGCRELLCFPQLIKMFYGNLWVSRGALGTLAPSLRTANPNNSKTTKTLLCQWGLHEMFLVDSPTNLFFYHPWPLSMAHTWALLMFLDLPGDVSTSVPLHLLQILSGLVFPHKLPWLSSLTHLGLSCFLSTPNTLTHSTRLQSTDGYLPAILAILLHVWGWLPKTNLSEINYIWN